MAEWEEKLQSILGNPEAMGQIMSIAQSLGGAGAREQPSAPPPQQETGQMPEQQAGASSIEGALPSLLDGLDPRLLQVGMELLSEYNSTDERKLALLAALRPFVKEKRWAKVDKAIQIARLSHVIRVAIDTFKKGGSGHV